MIFTELAAFSWRDYKGKLPVSAGEIRGVYEQEQKDPKAQRAMTTILFFGIMGCTLFLLVCFTAELRLK